MSVPVYGYVVNNKARVALERASRNPRKRVMGVDWESKLTFGFMTQGMGVGHAGDCGFLRCSAARFSGCREIGEETVRLKSA